MKMKPVDSIPAPKRCVKHPLQDFIMDFMDLDSRIVLIELEENEYKSVISAEQSFKTAVKRSGYPIKVARRKDKIFLMKI